jgi:hypothetical protein
LDDLDKGYEIFMKNKQDPKPNFIKNMYI